MKCVKKSFRIPATRTSTPRGQGVSGKQARSRLLGLTDMTDHIRAGAVLIQEGTVGPDSLTLETDPCSAGWRTLKNLDRREFDDELFRAGWVALCHASEIRTSGSSFDRRRAMRTAMERLLSRAESAQFNSLEVLHVATKCFLGLHSVMVFARPRHIQLNPFLSVA